MPAPVTHVSIHAKSIILYSATRTMSAHLTTEQMRALRDLLDRSIAHADGEPGADEVLESVMTSDGESELTPF